MCINCANYTNCATCGNPNKTSIWNACPTYPNQEMINNHMDLLRVSQRFIDEYYQIVSTAGWNKTMYIYATNPTIACNNTIFDSGHDFLAGLSSDYIQRANYGLINANWSLIDEYTSLVTVFGEIQLVNFTGGVSGIGHFSDSFVIKMLPGNTYAVTNHSLYIS